MKCPFCNHPDTQVVETRESEDGENVRRRRRCLACDKRFTTFETVELRMPQVVKQNGTRCEFEIAKLRASFVRPLHKRSVPTEAVDAAISRVTQTIFALGEREIESREIGEMVMKELLALDKVAYIRFASIYQSFQGIEDFTAAIKAVNRPKLRRRETDKQDDVSGG